MGNKDLVLSHIALPLVKYLMMYNDMLNHSNGIPIVNTEETNRRYMSNDECTSI